MTRKYRSPMPLSAGLVGSVAFLIIGASMLADEREAGGVSALVAGSLGIALACAAGSVSITNMVVLAPEGMTWRYNFRRRTIPWEAVESFRVPPAPGMAWSSVTVELRPLGTARISSIAGTRRYIQRVIAEFEAYRAQLAAYPRSDGLFPCRLFRNAASRETIATGSRNGTNRPTAFLRGEKPARQWRVRRDLPFLLIASTVIAAKVML